MNSASVFVTTSHCLVIGLYSVCFNLLSVQVIENCSVLDIETKQGSVGSRPQVSAVHTDMGVIKNTLCAELCWCMGTPSRCYGRG